MPRRPLLFRAHHRLLVRGPHHDAVFVSELCIQWIVSSERVVPHGRPKKICLQPQKQLEHLCIELMIHSSELLFRPSR